MSEQRPTAPDVPPGRGLLRRHAGLIVATTLLVSAGGYGYAALQSPTYTAHARVLVEPLTLPPAAPAAPDMGTEQAVATSSTVLARAASALRVPLGTVANATSVSVLTNANMLDFAYSAPTRSQSRDGATAAAQAYMNFRASTNALTAVAHGVNAPRPPDLETRLVTAATLPTNPSAPDLIVDVLAGLVVGLIAACGLAYLADRFGQRIRTTARWQEVSGVPVLAVLHRESIEGASPVAPTGRDPLAPQYLRVRAARALPASAAVLLVTAVREQSDRPAAARLLTDALVDTGTSAVLIEIDGETPDPIGSADSRRTGDLRVRVSVSPGAGRATHSAGQWRSMTIAELLRVIEIHRADHDVSVVAAPPISASVTTLDIAAVADTCLLIDRCATARRRELTRTVSEFRAAGCEVSGGVLLASAPTRTAAATSPPVEAPALPPALRPAGPSERPDRTDRSGRPNRPNRTEPARRAKAKAALSPLDQSAPVSTSRHDTTNGRPT